MNKLSKLKGLGTTVAGIEMSKYKACARGEI